MAFGNEAFVPRGRILQFWFLNGGRLFSNEAFMPGGRIFRFIFSTKVAFKVLANVSKLSVPISRERQALCLCKVFVFGRQRNLYLPIPIFS